MKKTEPEVIKRRGPSPLAKLYASKKFQRMYAKDLEADRKRLAVARLA